MEMEKNTKGLGISMDEIGQRVSGKYTVLERDIAVKVLTDLENQIGTTTKTYAIRAKEYAEKMGLSDNEKVQEIERAERKDKLSGIKIVSLTAHNSFASVRKIVMNAKCVEDKKK